MALSNTEYLTLSALDEFNLGDVSSVSDVYGIADSSFGNSDRFDSNSEVISRITKGRSPMIVEELADYRTKMEAERDQLDNLLSDNLKVARISALISNESITDDPSLVFDNFRSLNDIKRDSDKISEFIDMMLEYYKKSSEDIEDTGSLVRASLKATLYWNRIDLNKAGIGEPYGLCALATKMLEGKDFSVTNAGAGITKLFEDFFAVYIEDVRVRKQYIRELKLKGFKMASVINPDEKEFVDGKISKISKPSIETLFGKISDSLESISKISNEFLVVILDALFDQLETNLGIALKSLKRHMEKGNGASSTKRVSFVMDSLKDNVRSFRQYCRDKVRINFDIQAREAKAVIEGTLDIDPKQSQFGGIMRVIGEIDDTSYLRKNTYPIALNGDQNETTRRLYEFLLDGAPSGEAMGGFIMTNEIAPVAMTVMATYYQKLLANKKKNIKKIDDILKKISRGVKKEDVNKTARELRSMFEPIKTKNKTASQLYALNAVKAVLNEYKRLRSLELKSAREFYEDLKKVDPDSNDMKALADKTLTKLAHYQIKSRLYRKLVKVVYTEMDLPSDYLSQMEESFDAVDSKLIEEVRTMDIPEDIRERMIELMMKEIEDPVEVDYELLGNSAKIATSASGSKKTARDSSGKIRLSASQKKMVESKEFWEAVRDKLLSKTGVKTVFASYFEKGIAVNSYGLLDIIESGVEGKAKKVKGVSITQKSLGRDIASKGRLMVVNDEVDKDDVDTWKSLDFKKVIGFRTEGPLRLVLWEMLSSKVGFGLTVGSTGWLTSDSMVKIVVMRFCRADRPYVSIEKDCSFLTSRQEIGKALRNVKGVPFA